MSIVVVGSVAFDSVKTPYGEVRGALGGSANYFSIAASYFSSVRMVGVVGEDFPQDHLDFLRSKDICTRGIYKAIGKTFSWEGKYEADLANATTLATYLNVFESFKPDLPEDYRGSNYVFLANIDPDLQRQVLKQVEKPKVIACDTMNFWIEGKNDSLKLTLEKVDILFVNEAEIRSLTKEYNLLRAVKEICKMGPSIVVVKRGEHGALLYCDQHIFAIPAYPLETVKDPTGAGDSFAGGFMGYLAKSDDPFNHVVLRKAMMYGTVMAAFNVEDFSFKQLKNLEWPLIEKRYQDFLRMISL